MQYEWLAFNAQDAKTLEADVDAILEEFGSNYRITFLLRVYGHHP
jgi:hypothetical protein